MVGSVLRGDSARLPLLLQPCRKKQKLTVSTYQPCRPSDSQAPTRRDHAPSAHIASTTPTGNQHTFLSAATVPVFAPSAETTAASSVPVSHSRKLFSLPQEILDIIFDFAYPEISDLRIKGRYWYEKEAADRQIRLQELKEREYHWTEKMSDYAEGKGLKVYPGAKIDEFLVSKRFFQNASRAYVANQTFDVYNVMSCIARDEKQRQRSILFTHTRHLKSYDMYPGNFDFPAIKTLELTFTGKCRRRHKFGLTAPYHCDSIEYDLDDFEQMPVFCALRKLRGLTKFTVTAADIDQAPVIFRANV